MPKNRPLRLVVDTNLWISFLISGRHRALDQLLYAEKITFIFSVELLDEISNTITKPKLRKYFSGNAMEVMLLSFEAYIELVDVKSKVNICRDAKDNFLLSLSKDGKADFLLTGDKDLLDLTKYGKTTILSIANFLEEMKQHE